MSKSAFEKWHNRKETHSRFIRHKIRRREGWLAAMKQANHWLNLHSYQGHLQICAEIMKVEAER